MAEKRLHAAVAKAAQRADPALPAELAALLVVPEDARISHLEKLRRPPMRTTGTALARYGLASKAASIERAPDSKKTALMTAVVRSLEAAAIDDALDLFALLMATRLISHPGQGLEGPDRGDGAGRGAQGGPGRGRAVEGGGGGRPRAPPRSFTCARRGEGVGWGVRFLAVRPVG